MPTVGHICLIFCPNVANINNNGWPSSNSFDTGTSGPTEQQGRLRSELGPRIHDDGAVVIGGRYVRSGINSTILN